MGNPRPQQHQDRQPHHLTSPRTETATPPSPPPPQITLRPNQLLLQGQVANASDPLLWRQPEMPLVRTTISPHCWIRAEARLSVADRPARGFGCAMVSSFALKLQGHVLPRRTSCARFSRSTEHDSTGGRRCLVRRLVSVRQIPRALAAAVGCEQADFATNVIAIVFAGATKVSPQAGGDMSWGETRRLGSHQSWGAFDAPYPLACLIGQRNAS